MGIRLYAVVALDQIISDEELDRYKRYQSLISKRKCAYEDARPPKRWIVVFYFI